MTALLSDPATLRGREWTVRGVDGVPSQRPASDPITYTPLVGVVAVVTVEVDLRWGQEHPDVFVSARSGYTWLGALCAASDAAGDLAAATGHVFRVSRTQRATDGGRLVDASRAP